MKMHLYSARCDTGLDRSYRQTERSRSQTNLIMKNLLTSFLIATTTLTATAQSPWTQKADMNFGRIGHEMAVLDGKIYALGGGQGEGPIKSGPGESTVEVYDPVTDTWTVKASMDTARIQFASCVFDGKILAFGGGRTFYYYPLMSVEEYDPVSDSWSYKTMLPRRRMGHVAALLDNKIYVIGGADSSWRCYPEVDVYDPVADTWTQAADMQDPRMVLDVAVAGGKIYALAGMRGRQEGEIGCTRVEVYDPETDTWDYAEDLNIRRKYASASTVDGKIYILGGAGSYCTDLMSEVERYTPADNRWKMCDVIPKISSALSTAVFNDKIYVTGGSNDGCPAHSFTSLFVYDPSVDLRPVINEFETDKTYAQPGVDSVWIGTTLYDTSGITMMAMVEAPDGNPVDSLPLFDDGNHSDGAAGDSLYANTWQVSSTDELHHYIDVRVTKISSDTIVHHIDSLGKFTTVGPVVLSDYEFTEHDTLPNPGDLMRMYLYLHNEGSSTSATSILARLTNPDSLVTIYSYNQSFPEIPAGETMRSAYYADFRIADTAQVGSEIRIKLEISSKGTVYWKDELVLVVEEPTDEVFEITRMGEVRIYPNPTTDQLTIDFAEAPLPGTRISILDITGKELYTEIHNTGSSSHTLDLSSLREGIYFVRIGNEQNSITEKLIIIK